MATNIGWTLPGPDRLYQVSISPWIEAHSPFRPSCEDFSTNFLSHRCLSMRDLIRRRPGGRLSQEWADFSRHHIGRSGDLEDESFGNLVSGAWDPTPGKTVATFGKLELKNADGET